MGRSTVTALIARGQNQNNYNNTGISTTGQWVDFFNAALQDLAIDLDIRTTATIVFDGVQTDYDLPADFVEQIELYDEFNLPVPKRQSYNTFGPSLTWNQGFYIYFAGSGYKIRLIDFTNSPQTFNLLYVRLPALLSVANADTQQPEIPTPCEDALIYYAIGKALANNNLLGQSLTVLGQYEQQRKAIRDNIARAALGGY